MQHDNRSYKLGFITLVIIPIRISSLQQPGLLRGPFTPASRRITLSYFGAPPGTACTEFYLFILHEIPSVFFFPQRNIQSHVNEISDFIPIMLKINKQQKRNSKKNSHLRLAWHGYKQLAHICGSFHHISCFLHSHWKKARLYKAACHAAN